MDAPFKKENKKSSKKRYTKQAKAIMELYETMPEQVQREVKALINETEVEYKLPKSKEVERLSETSLDDIWLTPENEHWDDFFKKQK